MTDVADRLDTARGRLRRETPANRSLTLMRDRASELRRIADDLADQADQIELALTTPSEPPKPAGAEMITLDQAAELARCHPRTIRRASADGELQAFRPGRRILLREADVRAWVTRRNAADTPPRRQPRTGSRGRPAPGSREALRALERELT